MRPSAGGKKVVVVQRFVCKHEKELKRNIQSDDPAFFMAFVIAS